MRGLVGVVLAVGLLAGCGAVEEEAGLQSPQASDARGEVEAMACNDCDWLFVRCMSRAQTPEAEQACEASLLDCRQTFCPCPGLGCPSARSGEVQQASVCTDACDARLNNCLSAGTVSWGTCFYRHSECVNNCPVDEVRGGGQADAR